VEDKDTTIVDKGGWLDDAWVWKRRLFAWEEDLLFDLLQ